MRSNSVACASRGWATLTTNAADNITYVRDDYMLVRTRSAAAETATHVRGVHDAPR
jgi:hypothetical protein